MNTASEKLKLQKEAIEQAVRYAVEAMGSEELKKCSWFGSSKAARGED